MILGRTTSENIELKGKKLLDKMASTTGQNSTTPPVTATKTTAPTVL